MKRILLILALASVLRLFYFGFLYSAQPEKFAIRDLDGYVSIAQNLLDPGVYSRDPAPPYTPDLSRPPLYPLLLAALIALGHSNGSLIVLFQAALGVLLAGLTYLLSRELRLGESAAHLATLLVALDPLLILLGQYLLSESLFLCAWIAGLVCFARYWNTRKLPALIASAFCLALAALTRPILEYLPFLLLAPILLEARGIPWGPRLRAAFLFSACFAVLLAPWGLRNLGQGGDFTLSDISDTNLYYYRAKAVLADVENISQDAAYQRLDEEARQLETRPGASAGQVRSALRARAFQILAQHPLQTLKMTARGAALLLFDPGYSLVCAGLDPNNFTPECFQGGASMLGANLWSLMAARFLTMSLLQQLTLIWSTLLMGLLYLGSAAGLVFLARQKRWMVFGLCLGCIVYFVALSSGAESLYRLRAPLLPLFALLSGFSLAKVARTTVTALL